MKKVSLIICILVSCFTLLQAQSEATKPIYNASKFGIRSDGVTMNTRSIQYAIDWISENGGGTLRFWVGRYLTGTIYMKSNVTLELIEGAIIVGSTNPFDYDKVEAVNAAALIVAEKVENVKIIGKGVIDGRGREVGNNFTDLVHAGLIDDKLSNDRVKEDIRPRLVYFREVKNAVVKNVTMKRSASWVFMCDQCENMEVDHILVESTEYWNNDGIDIVDCKNFKLTNSYLNATDDAICLKSHDAKCLCENIEVYNNTARSSASGIKFGTMGRGGFKNVKIINNKVYDTYRSAITIQSVDGGICENILVDSLYAINVGNPIYINVGDRRRHDESVISTMNGVTIKNLYCEVPATKPDAGYEYEGPVEDQPRNISPSGIVGLPESKIQNVTLENITIVYPGGGDPMRAHVYTNELDKVPEMPKAYPEFSQHKELPAWGFFVRHVKNITFKNIKITAQKADYRTPIVLDDVENSKFNNVEAFEGTKKVKDWMFERK